MNLDQKCLKTVMIVRMQMITTVIGIMSAKEAKPKAGKSAIKICSLPYAEEEMQSEERIPRANFFASR